MKDLHIRPKTMQPLEGRKREGEETLPNLGIGNESLEKTQEIAKVDKMEGKS